MSNQDYNTWSNDNSFSYVNFPICLLKDAITDIKKVCSDILSYALYECTLKFSGKIIEKIVNAEKLMQMNYPNCMSHFEKGQILFDLYSKGYPKAGIKYSTLIDFCRNYKTAFEIESFLGYCATRSIVQNRAYVRTTNLAIKARTSGLSTDYEYINSDTSESCLNMKIAII